MVKKAKTYIYPLLGASYDVWFARLAGHGLGNCFYNYFHAVVLAEKSGGTLIAPPWEALKIGPLLRGDASNRLYWGLFQSIAEEIKGAKKLFILLAQYRHRNIVEIDGKRVNPLALGKLNFITSSLYTFKGLHEHRELIRNRLIMIVKDPLPPHHSWGKGNFIAAHIRLGDFSQVKDMDALLSGKANVRIPLEWYMRVLKSLRKKYPDMPIKLFSDGSDADLRPLTDMGATVFRSGSDIQDLLMMSSASILVGARSTYSRWACFLGNMPSIWLQTEIEDEQPSSTEVPFLFVPFREDSPSLAGI